MPCEAVSGSATLLFMGAASQVCGGGVVLVPEVLFNIRLAFNAFKLCGGTKRWCRYMAAPMHTVLKTNINNELKLYGVTICLAGRHIQCSPGGESQLVTGAA